MNITLKTTLIGLSALLSIPAAVFYTQAAIDNQPLPQPEPRRVSAPLVTVIPTRAASYRASFSVHGEVRSIEELQLTSQVSGQVIWRNPLLAAGGRVIRGDTLIRLDDTDYRLALANARREQADASLNLQQEQRQQAQARRDWQRAGLGDKATDLALRIPQVLAAEARLKAAQVAVEQAERDLKQTRISAPFDAVVLSRAVGVGSYLSAGQAMAELRASSAAEVRVALSSDQWKLLTAMETLPPVSLRSEDWPGVRWTGRITRLSALVDPATRLRELVIRVEQPLDYPVPLLAGSFVTAQLQGAEQQDLLAIPASALSANGYLWYVERNQLQRRAVAPLFSDDDRLFVPRGDLPQSLQLVRRPLASFLPGMAVSTGPEPDTELSRSEQIVTATEGDRG